MRVNGKHMFLNIMIVLVALSIFSSITYSYHYVCLSYGEKLASGWTCTHDCCPNLCVTESNWGAKPSRCYGMPGCSCSPGNFSDLDAPIITINSPVDGNAYFS